VVMMSPFTPMLFMGEEWAASSPFLYFTDHPEPDIARATSEGRKRELVEKGFRAEDVPDPQDPQTFERSRLDWSERERPPHAQMLAFARALIALRRGSPELIGPTPGRATVDEERQTLVYARGPFTLVVNLGPSTAVVSLAAPAKLLLHTGAAMASPSSVEVSPDGWAILRE
jgi:maltooligosyltrehalose trehalohydrolase